MKLAIVGWRTDQPAMTQQYAVWAGWWRLESVMLSQKEQDCVVALNACGAACLYCAAACVKSDDIKMMTSCIAHDLECADFCRMAAASISRGDTHSRAITAICANICDVCAAECGKHKADHCVACAEACGRCAAACHAMIS